MSRWQVRQLSFGASGRLLDDRLRAYSIEIVKARFLGMRIPLGDDQNRLIFGL